MPNISFFIPAYNCAGTIAEAVDSIMHTNFKDGDELIAVNDCSTDDTLSVLKGLAGTYPQIKILNHARNKGGAAARNTAVEHATNNLLFCLDSDNVLSPDSIQPLADYLFANEAEVACFHELRYFSQSTELIDEIWKFEPPVFTINDLLAGKISPGASGNYLFTKESWIKVNGYTEDLGSLDTFAFGFKQLIEGCKTVVMPNSFYFHRRGHESYYLRDAWNRRKSVSLRLIKLIIPYIDRFSQKDIDYIFSKRGRYSWFDQLSTRPIAVLDGKNDDPVWEEHQIEKNFAGRAVDQLKHYRHRLKQISGK